MSGRSNHVTLALAVSMLVVLAGFLGQTRFASAQAPGHKASAGKVNPEINSQFKKADVKGFIKRFESDDREVYTRRHEITRAVGLRPGMSVADIGAGTGLFTRLFAAEVGKNGKVYAVDVSSDFLKHIADQARSQGQPQVVPIQGSQETTNLPGNSIDLAYLCDVYHHLENHRAVLDSIHRALRPGGKLVVVEFDRVEGRSTEFVRKHVRAGQDVFRKEIELAGFEDLGSPKEVKLSENFLAVFQKRAATPLSRSK